MKIEYLGYAALLLIATGGVYYFAPDPLQNIGDKKVVDGREQDWPGLESKKTVDLEAIQKKLIHAPCFGYVQPLRESENVKNESGVLCFYGVIAAGDGFKVTIKDSSDNQLYGLDSILPGFGTICDITFNSFTICTTDDKKIKYNLY